MAFPVTAPGRMTIQPPSSLTPGTWSWHVDVDTSMHASRASATWNFTVLSPPGAVDGVVNPPLGPDGGAVIGDLNATSWGTTFDINGDGAGDLAAGSDGVTVPGTRNPGQVDLYVAPSVSPGPDGGTVDINPTVTLTEPIAMDGAQFGSVIAAAGDVNGDGFGDLAVVHAFGHGMGVYVFYGNSTGRPDIAHATFLPIHGTPMGTNPRLSISTAGDVDADGYADLLVGLTGTPYSPDAGSGSTCTLGQAWVYFGSAHGIDPASAVELMAGASAASCFGISLAAIGTMPGNINWLIAVGASPPEYPGAAVNGAAFVFKAAVMSRTVMPVATLTSGVTMTGTNGDGFGLAISTGGDTNRDGFVDLGFGLSGIPTTGTTTQQGGALSFWGAPGPTFIPVQNCGADGSACVISFGGSSARRTGRQISGGFDLDDDGYPDGCMFSPSIAAIACGNFHVMESGMFTLTGPLTYAGAVIIPGDVDLDRHADILAVNGYSSTTVALYMGPPGSLSSLGAPPRLFLNPGSTGVTGFGESIAFAPTSHPSWRALELLAALR
jgi:hypothetical protein